MPTKIKYKKITLFFLEISLLTFLYFMLYKIYVPRILEFGCFDDCHTIATGYFISKGKEIYSEIFYNHQLIFPHLSAGIQSFTQPENLYELILRHRQLILLLSFLFNFIFILRFGKIGFIFVILFEVSKFYFFGDRFLPEALVVYPAIFLCFLIYEKFNGENLSKIDYLISSIYVFLIFFAREPYIPLATLLFLLILFNKKDFKEKLLSVGLFVVLSISILLTLDLKEFIYIFFTFNPEAVIKNEITMESAGGLGFIKFISYPFYLLFYGENNFLRFHEITLVGILLSCTTFYYLKTKNFKIVLISLLILGLASSRFVTPGQLFFEAYRLNIWYGLLIATLLFYLREIRNLKLNIWKAFSLLISISFLFLWFNKNSYLLKNPDPHYSLLTNYGRYHEVGSVLKLLSNNGDKLFVDATDELLYVVSDLGSNYKYSLYASQMPLFKKYQTARIEMFEKNPPDFYYDYCKTDKAPTYRLEKKYRKEYVQLLYMNNKPSCLFVYNKKVPEISKEKRLKIEEWGYKFPPSI